MSTRNLPRSCAPALAAAALLILLAPAAAGAAREPEAVEGAYVVVYRSTVERPAEKTDRLERANGFKSRFRYASALRGFAGRLNRGQAEAVRHDPDVLFVSPDFRVRASADVALTAGETVPPSVRRIGAATTTTARQASSATVAVIDTGIDLTHPDLNAADGRNCVGTGAAQDDNGHGTHVAGSIAARNNGSGVVGVAPGTKLAAVKVLDAAGDGTFSQIICGIDWVTSTRTDADPANDVAVANMSLGGAGGRVGTCETTTDPMHKAICRSVAAGVTYVVAAGNSGWDFDYASAPDVPAAYPEVLTVSAMGDSDGAGGALGSAPGCTTGEADDRYASFSNFAATSAGAAHLIAAPGVCVVSTQLGGGTTAMSGTSMATPHIAGAVALCIGEGGQTGPCASLTPAQTVARMRADAEARTKAQLSYGFAGDPAHPVGGAAFGYLWWAGALSAPATTPPPTTVSASPYSATIETGSLRSGGTSSLSADDNVFLQIASNTASTRTTSWYGRFSGVSRDLTSLTVSYRGLNSRTCSQVVQVYRWTTGSWSQIDSRSVGGTEVLVERSVGGTLSDYVSSAGDVAVRVRCTLYGSSFTTSADQLRITYTRP